MSIVIRRPWTRQPPPHVGLNPSSSLVSRNLVCLYSAARGVKNYTSGHGDMVVKGSGTIKPGPSGLGFYGGSSSNGWRIPTLHSRLTDGVGTNAATMIAIIDGASTSDQGSPIRVNDIGGALEHYPYAGGVYLGTFDNSRYIVGTASKVPLDSSHVLVIRGNASSKTAHQNGIELFSGAGVGYVYASTATGYVEIGSEWTGFLGTVPFVAFLDRYISDAELKKFKSPSDVYSEFFAPQTQRIWVPSAAGVPTLTSIAASSITSTGAVLTIN